jgi:protein SCO1/2
VKSTTRPGRQKVGAGATALLVAWLGLLSSPLFAQHDLSIGKTREVVPRYILQDANGRATSPEDFRGRFQLITFGYTFCPDICPTTLSEMAAILQGLGTQAENVQAIFISLDPERDSHAVLKTYTAFFDARIIGLTGSPALVSRTADNFKVRYQKVYEPGAPRDRYAVDHAAGMFLLGPDGAFLEKFAYATPASQITANIRQHLQQAVTQPPPAASRRR